MRTTTRSSHSISCDSSSQHD